MNKSEVLTIKINSDTLEAIRKRSIINYRSIAKEVNFILDSYLKQEEGKE
jgi:hypothetical protein